MNNPLAFVRELRQRKGLLLGLSGTALVLAATAIAVTTYLFAVARRELAEAIAETDRLDPGWRFEDLEAQRRLPPAEQNSAVQVLKASSFLPPQWYLQPTGSPEEGSAVHEVLRELAPERQPDENEKRLLLAALERAGPALELARKLADLVEGRYSVTWATDVISTPCPWWEEMFSMQQLLQVDALLRDHNGDPDGALISARALLNVGRSLGNEPFLRGPRYRNLCRRITVEALERSLAQGEPSEGALVAVQKALAREEAVPLLLAYFRGERAFMDVFLTRVDAGLNRISERGCVPNRGLSAQAETWLGRKDAIRAHARYLRGMNEAVEIAKLPVEQQYPLYREWRRRWGHVENVGNGLFGALSEGDFLTTHAQMRSAQVALAAECYRRAHGDWPQALTDLVPEHLPTVPLDPFDGEPLRYRRTESGVVIYSVGENGRDDGGDPRREFIESIGDMPRDEVFTLWDVAHRRQPPKPPEPATRP